MAHYVYVIESSSGHFKIGMSNDPKRRLKQLLATKGPYEYVLVNCWWFLYEEWARYVEKNLHRIYADKCVNGEWFQLEAKDLIGLGQDISILYGECYQQFDK